MLYDIEIGSLVLGDPALAPESARPLVDLLNPETLPFKPGEFLPLDCSRWERQDFIVFGHWLLASLGVKISENEPNRHTINKAHRLGLGPSRRRIGRFFDDLREYQNVIGQRDDGWQFTSWTHQDYVTYAQSIAHSIGGRPTEGDYTRAYKNGQGPSCYMILAHVGSMGELSEAIGYPDIRMWDKDDYIEWGARVICANGGTTPTSRNIDALSSKGHGPSTSTIAKYFAKFKTFQSAIKEKANEFATQQNAKRAQYEAMLADGRLPAQLRHPSREDITLRNAAQYLVMGQCIPERRRQTLTKKQWLDIACTGNPRLFIERAQADFPGLEAGEIEATALYLDVYEDIWPVDRSHLRFKK